MVVMVCGTRWSVISREGQRKGNFKQKGKKGKERERKGKKREKKRNISKADWERIAMSDNPLSRNALRLWGFLSLLNLKIKKIEKKKNREGERERERERGTKRKVLKEGRFVSMAPDGFLVPRDPEELGNIQNIVSPVPCCFLPLPLPLSPPPARRPRRRNAAESFGMVREVHCCSRAADGTMRKSTESLSFSFGWLRLRSPLGRGIRTSDGEEEKEHRVSVRDNTVSRSGEVWRTNFRQL